MRFIPAAHENELIDYWHLSLTALAGGRAGRWERLQYVARTYLRMHPDSKLSKTAVYKDADEVCGFGRVIWTNTAML